MKIKYLFHVWTFIIYHQPLGYLKGNLSHSEVTNTSAVWSQHKSDGYFPSPHIHIFKISKSQIIHMSGSVPQMLVKRHLYIFKIFSSSIDIHSNVYLYLVTIIVVMWWHTLLISELKRWRKENPWGSLHIQPSLLVYSRSTNGKLSLKTMVHRFWGQHLKLTFVSHAHTHTHPNKYPQRQLHTHIEKN